MSDYSKTVNFAAKDTLLTGNTNKVVRGTEIDTEFNAIATAVATKADKTGGTFTGAVTFQNDVTFQDGKKAKFGTGSDLEIYHDGSNSYIKDTGTGILKYTSNLATSFGTILEIENTNSASTSGAFVQFNGAGVTSDAHVPSVGNLFDMLVVKSNQKVSATIGSTGSAYNAIKMYDNANTAGGSIMTGSGSPEGAVSATVGSLFMRTDGGTGTSLYVKESGTGNTGWVAK